MSVRSEVVQQTIVGTISERARSRVDEPLPEPVATALDAVPHPTLARAGYFARVVERELFEPARRPTTGLAEELRAHAAAGSERSWSEAVSELASALAADEPLERPDPDDPAAVSWRVPGPGGHLRHYVALRLIGAQDAALKPQVIYGFLVRCCEEAWPP